MLRWGLRFLIIGLVLGSSFDLAHATERVRVDGHAAVRTYPADWFDLSLIKNLGFELLSENEGPGVVDYLVPPGLMGALRDTSIPYEILAPDVQVLIDAERERLANADANRAWFDDYKTFDEIITYLDSLIALRPDLISKYPIGTSIEGRTVWGVTLTSTTGSNKPALLFDGMLHSREWISPMTVMYFIDRAVRDYDTDPNVQAMLDSVVFYLVPVTNPDGYIYSWDSYRLWRKNRRDNGDGQWGVDLNRNFRWGWCGTGSDSATSSDLFRGLTPFSEPETVALRDYLYAHPNVVAYIDFHSYSQLILRPWGHDYVTPPEPDNTDMTNLGDAMRDAILGVHGVSYASQPGVDLYPAGGTCSDWAYGFGGVYSWTFELRDTGTYGFILPPDQILPTGEEIFAAIDTLASWAALEVRTTVEVADAPEFIAPGQSTTIDVEIAAIGEALVANSAQLYYRFDDGAYQTAALSQVSDFMFEATLPAASCGLDVEFYFAAAGGSTGVVTSPTDAPTTVYRAAIGEATEIVSFDFEDTTGWSVVDDPNLIDGSWEAGVPVNFRRSDPPFDADGSGQCFLTANDNTDSNSDVDNGLTWLISPAFDAGERDARVDFALWYSNNYGGFPNEDVFRVDLSNDDGANWTEVLVFGPVFWAGWEEHGFRISDSGLVPTNQMRVRFEASDLINGSVVEAAVDSFRVTRLEPCAFEAGDLNCDGVVDFGDINPFVAALVDPDGYPTLYPDCDINLADVDGNGSVGFEDINPFVALLVN